MSASWHKDPYDRAEYRWFDGAGWTGRVANGGVESTEPEGMILTSAPRAVPAAPPAAPAAAPAPSAPVDAARGRLVGAGVLSIITGCVTLVLAIMLLSVINSDAGGFMNDLTGGLGTAGVILFLALGAGFAYAGWGAVTVRAWSQVANIALGGVMLLLYVVTLLATGEATLLVPVLWFGAIVGLAVSYRPGFLGALGGARA